MLDVWSWVPFLRGEPSSATMSCDHLAGSVTTCSMFGVGVPFVRREPCPICPDWGWGCFWGGRWPLLPLLCIKEHRNNFCNSLLVKILDCSISMSGTRCNVTSWCPCFFKTQFIRYNCKMSWSSCLKLLVSNSKWNLTLLLIAIKLITHSAILAFLVL